MRTGRPRSYDQRISVNTNIEADLYSFGKDDLKIPACEALTLGYIGRIDAELAVKKGVDPEDLERYLEIRNRAFRDLVLEQKKEEEIIQRVSTLAQSVITEAKAQDLPDNTPVIINWAAIPDDQKLKIYIQQIMEEDFRAFWISKYNSADEEDQFDVLTKFADDIICRHQADPNKPFRITDKNEIRKVLRTWADSARGL